MINLKEILPKRKSLSKVKLVNSGEEKDIVKEELEIEYNSSEAKKIDDIVINLKEDSCINGQI